MKKRNLFWCFTAAFLLLGLTLSMGTLVFGPSKGGANEQLSSRPRLILGDGSWNPDYLSDAASWYSDHFFLRQELISVNNLVSAKFFGISGSDSVILGKDGWLYYADTLADYADTNEMAERELFGAANNLALMAEYCRNNGKKFLFAMAPNKNSLYPMNMPERIPRGSNGNRKGLFAWLESMEVPYVDLFERFGREDEVLYFAHDSHWNSKGAALGADAINAGFGVKSDYYHSNFTQMQPHEGDLYEMLYPAFRDREGDPVYPGELKFTYTGNGKAPDSITLETAGEGEGKLLAYRDSFGNLLYPYLADTYGEVLFSRATVYDLTPDADYVLIELVERNIKYLLTYVPVMPSPVRILAKGWQPTGETTLSQTKGKVPEGCVQLQGTAEDGTGRVWVVCGEIAYEAFLLKDGGFAVNIPAEARPESVVYECGSDVKLLTVQSMK